MSDHPAEPGEGADDLFGRWLAHHEKPSEDGETRARPRRVPSSARPSETVAPVTRPAAKAALADAEKTAVDRRDGLGPVAAPSSFGVKKRGLPGTAHSGPTGEPDRNYDRGVPELDRPSPVGFEPVIISSVRKKKEPPPEDKDKGGRLKRLRGRVTGTGENGTTSAPAAPASRLDEPAHYVPPPVFKAPSPPVVPNAPAEKPPVSAVVAAEAVLAALATPAEESVAEPEAVAVPEPPVAEPEPTPRQKRKIVAYEDMIALATMAALPATEPDVEIVELERDPDPDAGSETMPLLTEPEPVVEPEPEPEAVVAEPTPDSDEAPVTDPVPVVEPVEEPGTTGSVLPDPELDTPPTPHPVLPEQQDDEVPPMAAVVADPSAPITPPTKRRLVARPKTADPKRHPLLERTDTAGAARGMIAATRASAPAPAEARPSLFKRQIPAPVVETAPVDAVVDRAVPIAPVTEMPPVYEFAPLRTSRRFLSLMLAVGLAASAYVDYVAYLTRDTVAVGVAAMVTFGTLVIWAVRAGASVTRLTVRSGQLEIVRQGGRMVFDLTSHYTPIEIVGKPGSKKWKVHFLRRGMEPMTIDSTMVDGKEFMRVLGYYRPELVSR